MDKSLLALFATLACGFALAVEVEWIGGSGTSWATAANWAGGAAPSPTDTLLLEDEDPDGLLVLDQNRTIGGLATRNPIIGRTADYSHAINLGGNRLTVAGPFHLQQYYNVPNANASRDANHGDNYLTVSNGVFQVGTAESLAEVVFGRSYDNYYYAHFALGDNTVFDGHLGDVIVGQGTGGWGGFDLRNAAELRCGDETGVFRANRLSVGYGGNGARQRDNIEIQFGPALASLEVLDALYIAYDQKNTAWIGQRDGNGTPLPAGTDVKFGVDASRRAAISIGQASYWPSGGHFAAGDGGDCTAWVSTIVLGSKTTGGGGTAFGYLYLDTMDSVAMDVSGATQIGISFDASHVGTGRLALPPGTANFSGAVTVGSDYGFGELLLNGTTATVAGGITVGLCGVVSNVVQGASCGLDVPANASFALDGTMHVVFAAPDASDGANGTYWGFRMAGNQSVALAQLLQAGKIVIDDSQIPGTANIFYDEDADFTYIAHRASGLWPPTVVTRPLSIEVDPDVSTALVIDRADIDLSPAQDNMTVTFASDYDQTPADPSIVTLPPVTLAANAEPMVFENTLTYASQDAGSTTVAADVTVIPLLPRTTSALTWAGGATLTHHYRPEWRWSANWHPATGGPAADTPAHLVFDDTSHATNRVDCDRMVGGISVRSTSGAQVFDLAGNTLCVTNYDYTPTLYASEWAVLANHYHAARPTDGNLNVGNKNTPSTAVILGPGTIKFAKGGMLLDNNGDNTRYTSLLVTNAVLDADFGTVRFPTS